MIEVQIPATSANLGSGFDSVGLALSMHNVVRMQEADRLEIRSLDGVSIPLSERNLVYRAACHLYEHCGKKAPKFVIEQENRIPMTRGLGSSSACIVGGLVAANELLGRPFDRKGLVELATGMEGHPDNVAPAILGGFVVSVMEGKRVDTVREEVPPEDLAFALFIPDFPLSTVAAREALPKQVEHHDAVYNLSRVSMLTAAFLKRDYERLEVATGDRLHQPYRLPLIAHAEEIFQMAKECGAYTSTISGAGSSLLSILPKEREKSFAKAAREWMGQRHLTGWRLVMLGIDNEGVRVV